MSSKAIWEALAMYLDALRDQDLFRIQAARRHWEFLIDLQRLRAVI